MVPGCDEFCAVTQSLFCSPLTYRTMLWNHADLSLSPSSATHRSSDFGQTLRISLNLIFLISKGKVIMINLPAKVFRSGWLTVK